MKPKLCKAGQQFRSQVDDHYSDRDRTSDGWVADARHMARGNSDHIPTVDGYVYALDIDRDLSGKAKPDLMPDFADQIRIAAKNGEKRIKYIIFDGKIASPILRWKFRPYKGANAHRHHLHISFVKGKSEEDSSFFNIPMIGGKI
jgi:hypothetical protein